MKIHLSLKHLFFFLIFLVGSVFAQETKGRIAQNNEIDSIISTYEKNQARFHLQYKGKIQSGTADVESIKTDIRGSGELFYINLSNGTSLLSCITRDRGMAAKFDKNQTVEFSGVIDDVIFERLLLTDCSAKLKVKPKLLNDDSIAKIFSEQQKIPYVVAKFLVSQSKAGDKEAFSERQIDKDASMLGEFLSSTLVKAIDLNQDGKLDFFFKLNGSCGNLAECGHFIVFSKGSLFEIAELRWGNEGKNIKFDSTKKPPIIMMSGYHLQWKGGTFATVYQAPNPIQVNCKSGAIIWDTLGKYQFKGRLSVIEQRKQMNPTQWAIWSERDSVFLDGNRVSGYEAIWGAVDSQCPGLLKN